ncbi:MFS transporter [Streptomyces sp. NRRL_B-16638]|jgi:EmrB/QacA subfamily drug resistance transporter|uniref:Integral membrane efflux protein n=2 Tax=Streptomyces coelicolor TaxID=1902 RepID=Q99QG4_STRCO|nr:MFS transporter [Streptomyces sp. NRRL_B-16638]AGO88510.1 integral membrane efflux protein [Streptomyces coelicolor]MDX2928858.1 MFS transporter [Streptomyces sp. NRRL_B-16638]CAC36567.1 putative integral membrane efflux protein [Streptomyces coelicolor A3(2)]CAC36834.1 putative integral membrane efflux protein [Streptomyces coelicolor A3(2)]
MPFLANTPVEKIAGPYARRWWALLVLCLSLLITVMANTSLIVAAPDMTTDLGLSSSDLQWVVDSYTVPYAALMLVLGAIGDKYSRRGALVLGLLIFAGGSVMGSMVDETSLVIVARAIMGVGAAVVMPATLSLVVATFPRSERAKAITAWAATSGVAVAVGPLVSGWLLEDHAWGSTFLINVPIAVLAVFGALALVPPSKAEGMGRIDYVGGLLSIVTVGSLIYAAIEGPHAGWGAGPVTAAVVAGAGLIAFVAWELRHPHPMLDVRKFALRPFSGSMLAVMFFFFGMFAVIYYSTQFLQFVLGYGALETGVRLLPLGGAVFLGSALTGMLAPKLGVRVMAVTGLAIGTAGMLLLTQIDKGSTYGDFLAPLMMLGLALGLAISPATDTIMGSFPESELGVGGGVNDTALELGGALGIAVLGSLLGTAYRDELTDLVGNRLPAEAMETAKDSVGAGLAVAERVAQDPSAGPQQAQAAVDAVHQAFAHGVAQTSLIGGIIMAAGTLIVLAILPGRRGFAQKGAEPGAGTTASEAAATDVREHTGATH